MMSPLRLYIFQDWAFYFQYGSQSWEHITDPDGRRRVGLRFMFMLLQLDPPAYQVGEIELRTKPPPC